MLNYVGSAATNSELFVHTTNKVVRRVADRAVKLSSRPSVAPSFHLMLELLSETMQKTFKPHCLAPEVAIFCHCPRGNYKLQTEVEKVELCDLKVTVSRCL